MEGESGTDEVVVEGKAKIKHKKGDCIFYNPVQKFNRDLTVAVLRQFVEGCAKDTPNGHSTPRNVEGNTEGSPPEKKSRQESRRPIKAGSFRILDALSASGLRALRFAKEVPGVERIVANDYSSDALDAIKENVKLNGVEHLVEASYGDAIDVMMKHRCVEKQFHAVDLDPYGSAAQFLDSAVQAVADGGILMVTCTDMATLCGNTPEACFNKYGSIPLKHRSCHEVALRILLRTIDSHAVRHGRYIKPLISMSIDFYIRCFVQLRSGALGAKESVLKLSHVRACATCHSLELQPLVKKSTKGKGPHYVNAIHQTMLVSTNGEGSNAGSVHCVHCGQHAIHIAGPIYTAPIHDVEFVKRLLKSLKETPVEERFATYDRMVGMLTVISEELHDVPLYYEHDQLMSVVRCTVPKLLSVRSAILNAGYRCSIAHSNPKALKTDAPASFLWDICRAWAKKCGVDPENLKNNPGGKTILSATATREVNFSINPLAIQRSKSDCLLRFQDNKGKDWGPRTKAKPSSQQSFESWGEKV